MVVRKQSDNDFFQKVGFLERFLLPFDYQSVCPIPSFYVSILAQLFEAALLFLFQMPFMAAPQLFAFLLSTVANVFFSRHLVKSPCLETCG